MTKVHRNSFLKETHKKHKTGRHRSKHEINNFKKEADKNSNHSKKKSSHELSKCDRLNRLKQSQNHKRELLLSKKRLLGTNDSPPFLICVFLLNDHVRHDEVIEAIMKSEHDSSIRCVNPYFFNFNSKKLKSRFQFVFPSQADQLANLNTLKVADTVLLVGSAKNYTDEESLINQDYYDFLKYACCQGLPSTTTALLHLNELPQNKVQKVKDLFADLIGQIVAQEKIYSLSNEQDSLVLLRKISSEKKISLKFRENRSFMIVDTLDFDEKNGLLAVNGYVRNRHLPVNNLVHLVGCGDFQIEKIELLYDPNKERKQKNNNKSGEETTAEPETESIKSTVYPDVNLQQDLVCVRESSEMDIDQLMLSNDEDGQGGVHGENQTKKYGAGFLLDNDDDDTGSLYNDDDDDDNDDVDAMDCEGEDGDSESYESEAESQMGSETASMIDYDAEKYDKMADYEKDQMDLLKLKRSSKGDEDGDGDGDGDDDDDDNEVDTPIDVPVRTRYQKYRFLKSFRKSIWDPLENLPNDYERIFSFKNMMHTRNRILKKLANEDEGPVRVGSYARVFLRNFRSEQFRELMAQTSIHVLMGMLPYEQKMTVMNVIVKRTNDYPVAIRSKQSLIIECGYRRMKVNPIFSKHTAGDKFVYVKNFRPDETLVATFYAPVQYPPANVLVFKEDDQSYDYIGNGSLLGCNPNRIIVKKIVLTGYPFKINKRSVFVRFMFYDLEDIKYYKKCHLKTSSGAFGKILQSMGTHGHMKCKFSRQIQSGDIISLTLYKRVFPKWQNPSPVTATNESES